jgi:pimeloyl-ACP methyl ester carboxylesterase
MPLLDLGNGARLNVIHHRPAKDAPTFVFVNSSGATAAAWEGGVAPALREAGFGTLALDLRGQGDSIFPTESSFETEEIVGDLTLVLDRLEVGPCILVGLSVGGLRAAVLAKTREQVQGLVLINTLRRKGALTAWLGELETRLIAIGGTQLVHDCFRPVTVSQTELAHIRPRHLVETPYAPMEPDHPRRRLAEAARRADWDFPWETLTMPVLVLTGLHDRLFRVEADVDALLARLPNAREVRFDNEGHALHTENPARTADELAAFATAIGAA